MREPQGTFESSLLLIILKTISDDVHDPELLTLTQGHQQKWIKKSCVSFEEECTWYKLIHVINTVLSSSSGTKCADLNDPTNGMVHNGNDRVYEDKANYTCQPGYEFPGGALHIETECNSTGQWSIPMPTCQSKSKIS